MRARLKCGANQRNILPIHATHVEIDERPGDGTKQGLAPAAAEQLQHDQAPVPGDIVDHEVDALRAEDNHKVFTASYQGSAASHKPDIDLVLLPKLHPVYI